MSKGLGTLQKKVLGAIDELGKDVTLNHLVWHLAEIENQIVVKSSLSPDIPRGDLKAPFNTSIRRAIESLNKKKFINLRPRKLLTIQEFTRQYPYKTLKLEILSLRKAFLPTIEAYICENNLRRYNVGNIESYLIDKLSKSSISKFKSLTNSWIDLEALILRESSALNDDERKLLINIVIKGRQLFLDKNISYSISLQSLIKRLTKDKLENFSPSFSNIIELLNDFYAKYFHYDNIGHTWLKSQIYAVASLTTRTSHYLRPDTKKMLYDRLPSLVIGLPEHKEPERHHFGWDSDRRYSPWLDKLIDRHAFSQFLFLGLN